MTQANGRPVLWRSRRFWVTVAIVVGLAVAVGGLIGAVKKETSELPVYTTGAARMAEQTEIYRPEDLKTFTYPPFFALPFLPLVPFGDGAARALFFLVNLASLAAIVLAIQRIARPVLRHGRAVTGRGLAWFWVPVALVAGRHVNAVFENQSHDLLVFLLIVLGVLAMTRLRETVAGAWIGVAAACKATPLLFLPLAMGQRRVRMTLAIFLAVVLATVLPDVLFPRPDGRLWVTAWFDIVLSGVRPGAPADGAGAWGAHSVLNQNLAGAIYRLTTPVPAGPDRSFVVDVAMTDLDPTVVKAVTIAAQLLVLAVIAWAAWPTRSKGLSHPELGWRRAGEAGAVVCGMVLLSPMSSKAHFCVLLLPVAFCVAEHFFRARSRTAITLLAVAFVLGLVSMKGLTGSEFGNRMLAFGAVTWIAVLVLLATAAVLVRRPVPLGNDPHPA